MRAFGNRAHGGSSERDDDEDSKDDCDRILNQRGDPVVSDPNENGFAYLKQNYLESSNVDPVKEITDLITAQRAYEMNSKVITTADEMAQIVSKNLK